ncbi:PIG-L deacetylase family protein [Elusimicrobiota bacterium]
MNEKILIVAAHPDDEVLGCGGTVARLIKQGCEAYTLILGEGITSRDEIRDEKKRSEEIESLKNNAIKASSIIGVKDIVLRDLPDNRFDTVEMLQIVKLIESMIRDVDPQVIFTHYCNDLNIDHQITYKALITAARPGGPANVKSIYSFEVLSSSEWNYPKVFTPNVYYDISDTVQVKLRALKEYEGEMREYPHPRSLKAVDLNAQKRGSESGLKYAEAYEAVRIIK